MMKGPSVLTALAVVSALSLMHIASGLVVDRTDCCNCDSLKPENVPDNAEPQTMPSPFKIIVEEDKYSPGELIHVNLVGTGIERFRSFALVAYTYSSRDNMKRKARGQLTLVSKDYNAKPRCDYRDSSGNSFALVSQEKTPVQNLKFIWKPSTYYGHIEFRATFIKNDYEFWVREKSRLLYDSSVELPPQIKQQTRPINTHQCGKTKGCFREPANCVEPQCLYILTWVSNAENIVFELGGLSRGSPNSFVAAALSDDKDVGDDTVFVCADNHEYKTTEVYVGKLDDYDVDIEPKYKTQLIDGKYERTFNNYASIVTEEDGSHEYNRLQCRFTVSRNLGSLNRKLKTIGRDSFHLLMFNGLAEDGKPGSIGAGHDEFPHVSADKVSFARYSNSDGKASYPLVKAHGCLMILAWVLFSSVGFLLAKYYQPMWPENRFYERKYWFTGHFNCMVVVFILVVIGVILIFVEAGGYSRVDNLPYEAHPILGIIIFICVLLLPIIGLIRPGPGHRCRSVSNWMYWIIATIANVLAIPNIFIGMDFGKSSVPWWATWILVIWVIFHIVVEITLEVHQCMTHKKNKERRKKHELLKRDYPKQHHPKPEPAGRRFKSFMLTLHLAVTILIVLIMIIIIAVS